jgi:hypothetical protein
MCRRLVLLAAALAMVVGLAAGSAMASRKMQVGIYDEAQVLGNPTETFPVLQTLRAQVVRVNLHWGGTLAVATKRPKAAADPDDPAYDWAIYDRLVREAANAKIKVVFSIVATPRWANGGRAVYYAPKKAIDLQRFSYAAAKRYSGTFRPAGADPDAEALPGVRLWLAWNEPNNPAFLRPQWRRAGGRWVIQSTKDYAKICNAVYKGVHSTLLRGEKVGCGVTAPRGNNGPTGIRPAVSPLPFLRGMRKARARFDVYAHHPYYGKRQETPKTKPRTKSGAPPRAVTLANISVLIKELTRLYGQKRLWITEYGYQTYPQDRFFGVTWAQQARYLKQAFAIARKNPRIDMMLWFLLRDEPPSGLWQSGFMTYTGKKKPSFNAFRTLRR